MLQGHSSAQIQAREKCYVGSGWTETGLPTPMSVSLQALGLWFYSV